MRFTGPFNLSGSPSLTMCGGFDDGGAPIGFQLVGQRLSESRLLELGAAYQDATDHHTRRPDLG
jgi:amidase